MAVTIALLRNSRQLDPPRSKWGIQPVTKGQKLFGDAVRIWLDPQKMKSWRSATPKHRTSRTRSASPLACQSASSPPRRTQGPTRALYCAPDDGAVRRFGRDDVFFFGDRVYEQTHPRRITLEPVARRKELRVVAARLNFATRQILSCRP
jgi:hypothetical protein